MASNDPRWITARFASRGECGHQIAKGATVFWYPLTRSVFCPACSDAEAASFRASTDDERAYATSAWR